MLETGLPGYRSTPGNHGVYMLRRATDAAGCEFRDGQLVELAG
jgi:hypothetical protein